MHTQASRIYHTRRIPTHSVQFFATACVCKYLSSRYSERLLTKHRERILQAIKRLEICYNVTQREVSGY